MQVELFDYGQDLARFPGDLVVTAGQLLGQPDVPRERDRSPGEAGNGRSRSRPGLRPLGQGLIDAAEDGADLIDAGGQLRHCLPGDAQLGRQKSVRFLESPRQRSRADDPGVQALESPDDGAEPVTGRAESGLRMRQSRILDPQVRHGHAPFTVLRHRSRRRCPGPPVSCYCFRDAASWVSVSVNALTAASRYWPMPVRPWIILVAPELNCS
jgi:hypothetical protein